jgi:bifunctional UDP-N-acetylglucosamine pyrophosphorylase/glucosamine-1-phosphate N-acetyltransferase
LKTVVILAAGEGKRMWPYAVIRPKCMIPIANKPVIGHMVETLKSIGFENIIIAGGKLTEQIANHFRKMSGVKIVKVDGAKGTAFALKEVSQYIPDDNFLVLHGDTIIEKHDLEALVESIEKSNVPVALIEPLNDELSNDWICCAVNEGNIHNVTGHPRYKCSHRFCGFALTSEVLGYIECNSGIFSNVNVGVMPPLEGYLEMSLADYISDGNIIKAVETKGTFIDMDKPWHILEANRYMVNKLCNDLSSNALGENAEIDSSAVIEGYVRLGDGSRIGRNVIIKGSIIVGNNTIIDNGAIIEGNAVIGDNCIVRNYCQIGGGSSIGNRCIIEHCAEFSGITMDRVHLYHYMELGGIIGTCTDIGAATVCGGLRFDDGITEHRIRGRREKPKEYANSSYLGDFSRTGVNAIIMPGCKTGVYSIVGPGVLLNEDLPDNTMIMVEQQTVKKHWGPEKYGW